MTAFTRNCIACQNSQQKNDRFNKNLKPFEASPRKRPIFKGFASLAAIAPRTQLLKT